jgi:hypothetical protein
MKIYTQLNDEEVSALCGVDVGNRRWTEERADFEVDAVTASALVLEDQVDFIRSRQAREDGGLSKEICLFRGAKVSDVSAC